MLLWLPKQKHEEPASTEAVERPKESARETVDQLLYSFALLLVGRAFLLEPFVIPTGSMAPTLYGRHKECVCSECGYEYQIGASSEVDSTSTYVIEGQRIILAKCPVCRNTDKVYDNLAFNGDHVLVNKWIYKLGSPERFDVFVFKFPLEPFRNYIKRLIGLPNERVRIRDGDLYLVTDDGEQILRKEQPRKRKAMTQVVHDDSHVATSLADAGWPDRWAKTGVKTTGTDQDRRYEVASGEELRYSHWTPTSDQWQAILDDQPVTPERRLISDYCFYNASDGNGNSSFISSCTTRFGILGGGPSGQRIIDGDFWVPDIGFECQTESTASELPTLTLELVEGVFRYRCRIDFAAGSATLVSVNVAQDADDERLLAEATIPKSAPTSLRFSNIDDELVLWIDGLPVDFGDGARYERNLLDDHLPTDADLSPIGVTVESGAVTLSKLRVFRDVHYVADADGQQGIGSIACELSGALNDPAKYAEIYSQSITPASVELQTGPDGYLALGDNSPRSRDSRAWGDIQEVPASHLVGKAFWVYWPHGIPFLNEGRGIAARYYYQRGPSGTKKLRDYPRNSVPFYPQFSRMARIR